MKKYRYMNASITSKTFYGVTFQPGESKDVPGYINDISMVRVPEIAESNVAPKQISKKVTDTAEKSAETTTKKSNKEE